LINITYALLEEVLKFYDGSKRSKQQFEGSRKQKLMTETFNIVLHFMETK